MGKTYFIGYRHVDYTAKDGRHVEGYSLYFTEEREGVLGLCSYDAYVNIDTFVNFFSCISIGSSVELSYNRYGKICGVSAVY